MNNVVVKNGNVSSVVGGLSISPSKTTGNIFHNNTVAGNVTSSIKAAGVICSGGETLINSIVHGNLGSGQHSSCTFQYSDVEGGVTGTGNIDVPPQFVDLVKSNFSLKPTSGCINKGAAVSGLSDIDVTGGARVKGAKVDLGAYEVQ